MIKDVNEYDTISTTHVWQILPKYLLEKKKGFKSMPTSAQYVTLQKYFSHSSLVIYFFATSPIKLKWGLQIGGNY
jgi:hypothetical protein